jgi:hypothetical protein
VGLIHIDHIHRVGLIGHRYYLDIAHVQCCGECFNAVVVQEARQAELRQFTRTRGIRVGIRAGAQYVAYVVTYIG